MTAWCSRPLLQQRVEEKRLPRGSQLRRASAPRKDYVLLTRRSQPVDATLYLKRKRWSVW